MVGYKAYNQLKIYNAIIKKIHISQDVRFNEEHTYNFRFNKYNKKTRKFWSLKNNKQLAVQKKKQKNMILMGTKKAVGAIIDGTVIGKKVRKKEKNLANTDNKSFLTFLEDKEPLILLKPRNPPIIRSVLPEVNFD